MRIAQPDRELLKEFIEKQSPLFSGDILDVGGGTGRYRGYFTHAKRYRILDPDPALKPDIVGSAEEIPLQDASVDGVVCTQVLGDVWDVRTAVAEMARVLRPGGLLIITESLINELHDEPHDYWRITPESWAKLLSPFFEIVSIEARGGYFSMRTQNSIRRMIEKYSLYKRPVAGRVAGIIAAVGTWYAKQRDSGEKEDLRRKFAIGFNILAKKKAG